MSLLQQLGTEQADDQRARILARNGDWNGSLAALSDLSARRVPREGKLEEEAQAILLRQADAASQAHDAGMLRSLAASGARIDGTRADVFRLLTAPPLDSATDLPRASRELAAARMLPQRLQTVGVR